VKTPSTPLAWAVDCPVKTDYDYMVFTRRVEAEDYAEQMWSEGWDRPDVIPLAPQEVTP